MARTGREPGRKLVLKHTLFYCRLAWFLIGFCLVPVGVVVIGLSLPLASPCASVWFAKSPHPPLKGPPDGPDGGWEQDTRIQDIVRLVLSLMSLVRSTLTGNRHLLGSSLGLGGGYGRTSRADTGGRGASKIRPNGGPKCRCNARHGTCLTASAAASLPDPPPAPARAPFRPVPAAGAVLSNVCEHGLIFRAFVILLWSKWLVMVVTQSRRIRTVLHWYEGSLGEFLDRHLELKHVLKAI